MEIIIQVRKLYFSINNKESTLKSIHQSGFLSSIVMLLWNPPIFEYHFFGVISSTQKNKLVVVLLRTELFSDFNNLKCVNKSIV